MNYTKKLFNLRPEKAKMLEEICAMTGLTQAQIVNDALALHYELEPDPMSQSRQVIVRQAAQRIQESRRLDASKTAGANVDRTPAPKRTLRPSTDRKRSRS